MSSPLRHRSPIKDQEVGPTPNRVNSAAGTAAKTPAASAAPNNASVPQESFLKRHKKKLIALVVVGAIVGIAVGASANKSSSTGSSTDTSSGRRSGSDSTSYPSQPTNTPSLAPTSAVTGVPTLAPTPNYVALCSFPNNLGVANLFNAFFEESFWSNGSSIEGRLAAGGDVYANQFSTGRFLYDLAGTEIPCPEPDGMNYAMVVGGALTINGTTVYNGGLVYDHANESINDAVNITTYNVESGCTIDVGTVSNVLDFTSTYQQLSAASAAINSIKKPYSFTQKVPGVLNFNLNGTIMTELFWVKESDLMTVNVLVLKGTPLTYNGTTATIIMNVIMDPWNDAQTFVYQGWSLQGFNMTWNKNILWNFPGYVNISLQNGNWPGSILAPDATMENCIGEIQGSVFAKSWNTGMAINNIKIRGGVFDGTIFWDNCNTVAPTDAPTAASTDAPTAAPTDAPTDAPTSS